MGALKGNPLLSEMRTLNEGGIEGKTPILSEMRALNEVGLLEN